MPELTKDSAEHMQSPNGDLQRASSAKALQRVQVPEVLVGSEIGKITLVFSNELTYVKIKFKVDENLKIECDGELGTDCVFTFKFAKEGSREKSFDVWAKTIQTDITESVEISCTDKKGRPLGATISRRIKLRPAPKPPDNVVVKFILWLKYKTKRWDVFVLVLLLIVIGVMFFYDVYPTPAIKSRLRDWVFGPPKKELLVYNQPWSEHFYAQTNNEPDKKKWDAPPEWALIKGVQPDQGDEALLTRGDSVGIIRLPESYSLYDYHVFFKIVVTAGQKSASWVVRAASRKDFYLFKFTFAAKGSEDARLEGYIYKNGQMTGEPLTSAPDTPIKYHPFLEGSILRVNINVKGNTFEHIIRLDQVSPTGDPNFFEYALKDNCRTFSDLHKTYPYGAFGFQGGGTGNDLKVEFVDIDSAYWQCELD